MIYSPTFYRIIKRKSVEEFQPYPYIATVLNCLMWIFYGLPLVVKDNILVTTINAIGLVIELAYLAIFCWFANDKKKRVMVFFSLLGEVVFTALVVLVAMLAMKFKHRALFVGIICDVFNIIMYASPLAIWISNGLGAIFGAIQLIIYGYYYFYGKRNAKAAEEGGKPSEVQLSNPV
ncbi:SWEET sugar transporter [Corchorus olitorius]|uniref:SWEET sugar transporter n=1 Tax=Corchorus olitorius TaxID=93759 RepID=A0A1R3HHF8_9ROSI|nr:SWEET sugar transporter [Corchorus olitorius]